MKLSSFLYSTASVGTIWLPILVGLALCVLGLILKHYFPLLSMRGRGLPKGSFGWPLLGETIGFLKPHTSHTVGNFLHDHITRYGKVFKSHLFFYPTVVSCDPELNHFILQNEDKLFQCNYPGSIDGILGQHSMLVTVGETHKRLRSVALSLVNTIKAKPQFLNDIQTTAINILDSWNDKDQILFCQEARKFTFNMIVKQVLGLEPEEPQTIVILEEFKTFMKGLISIPLYIPGSPYAKAVQARGRISSIIKSLIEERRRRYSSEDDEKSCDSKRNDFLDTLLCMDSLSEDEKSSFVLDSLLGGYETTSVLMAVLVHFLGQTPSALQQLKEEHQKIRDAKNGDELLTWDDFRKMEFTLHVISEALRAGNVVKFVHRKALLDVKFKDYVIPRGWKVLPVFTAVHLDPSLHSKSSEFHPWRFESQDATASKKFSPFGGGIRYCPGSDLAKVEAAFFLHHLVKNFRWTSKNGEPPIAHPYIEFLDGLVLDVERISS